MTDYPSFYLGLVLGLSLSPIIVYCFKVGIKTVKMLYNIPERSRPMINMWIKVVIGELTGIPVVLSMKYHFLPIYISIPLSIVASFACVYGLRDANNKLKENIKKYNLEIEK